MAIPREWPFPTKDAFLKDPISYLADMYAALAEELANPNWKLEGTQTVAGGLTTQVVTTTIDRLPATVTATPDWGTTVWVTGISTTGFTLHFGTAAPGGGGNVGWIVIQPEAGPA
jgi:hypothetical protein